MYPPYLFSLIILYANMLMLSTLEIHLRLEVGRGDVVVVESIGQLARSAKDFLSILETLTEKGTDFVSREVAAIQTPPYPSISVRLLENFSDWLMCLPITSDRQKNAAAKISIVSMACHIGARVSRLKEVSSQILPSALTYQ